MTLPKHLDEAVERLKEARLRLDAARLRPRSLDNLAEWLEAITDFSMALSEIHEYTNESIHEKLHEIGARLGTSFESPPAPSPPGVTF